MNTERIWEHARNFKSFFYKRIHKNDLWTVREICSTLHVEVPPGLDPDYRLSLIACFEAAIYIKGSLFVQYDYYKDDVAQWAVNRGAVAVLSTRQIKSFPCIIVPDVHDALEALMAPFYAARHVPATVITGSVGKTTTKNFVNCVYKRKYHTFCNITNGNTFEYLCYLLQRFDRRAKQFVQECNESDPRNAHHCSVVLNPEIALITNMDRSHIGELGSEENIMHAICEITDGMDENGVVIINGDDPNSVKCSFRQRVIRVAINDTTADCVASNLVSGVNSVAFDLHYNAECTHILLPIPGVHNAYDAMMAYVAGRMKNIAPAEIAAALAKYRPLGFRQNIYKDGTKRMYIDCYNASAKSVKSSLNMLDSAYVKANGRRIAILGDIAEIGEYTEATWQEIGQSVSSSKIDVLITYGQDSKIAHKYVERNTCALYHTSEEAELVSLLHQLVKPNDILLFKASRTMKLEHVVKLAFPRAYIKGMLPIWIYYLHWNIKVL